MTANSFTPPSPLNTAVLFLVFNRIDTTEQVFAAIKQAKPPRLYIAADGARADKAGEAEKVKAVREFILQNIDWECEVKTLFREENLGCKYAVSGAIDWFFEQEEMGIILEDDCLPSQSFFWFCEELLERYKDDMRVGHIAGFNHFPSRIKSSDYFFSLIPGIWGWACWANRWSKYDVEIKESPSEIELIVTRFFDVNIGKYWEHIYCDANNIDTWDYQWSYALLKNGFLTIRPSLNLISNIGFGEDATHTTNINLDIINNKGVEIDLNDLSAPNFFITDVQEERFVYKFRLQRTILRRVINKIKRHIRREA